ncbi:hypothetical protein FE257_003103 [Aspergillus nanangensis]|uniref:Trichodiene synthase n=1 Tax=Aspergillus nanangensis TaxID=2582783 RepID=A0AAD4GNQ8_ASPNN|nr:hypothetical protein FE257_003103 [Aspergillus nanangensis]
MTGEPSIYVEKYGMVVSRFLDDMGFAMPSSTKDPSLRTPVTAHFRAQNWNDTLLGKALHLAEYTSTGLGMVYPYVPRETKISYGIFSTYMFLIDDSEDDIVNELRGFQNDLAQGQPPKSPLLASMFRFVGTMRSEFGSYSWSTIFKSMIEFISGCVIEHRYNGRVRPAVGAVSFPYYLRQRAGIAEPFAHFAFPQTLYPEEIYLDHYILILEDMSDFVNYVNDVLSFYKESILGSEDVNYICNSATTQGVSTLAALGQTCDKAIQSVKNIRSVLASKPEMLCTTEQFLQAYISWYIIQTRYHLDDLQLDIRRGAET